MMLLSLLVTLLFITPAYASNNYSSLIISDEIKQNDANKNALDGAKMLSKMNIENLKLKKDEELLQVKPKELFSNKTSPAPFGLFWGASKNETSARGVLLKKYDIVDHPQSYHATRLSKPIAEIKDVFVSFGDNNKLWRILAYGKTIKDNADASKIYAEYQKYYRLLEQKYGNAEEFYVGAKHAIIKDKKEVVETLPIGNSDFLQQLQSGKAELYATFYNENVGVALAVNVDGEGHSYLTIDYKNIQIFEENEEDVLDSL